MRCACIDIGSNTTRLLVAEAPGGRLRPVLEQRAFTQIGQRFDAGGSIPRDTIAAVAEVVAAQRAAAAAAGAERLRVVATAAIRAAANRAELVTALRERAGVDVAVRLAQVGDLDRGGHGAPGYPAQVSGRSCVSARSDPGGAP